MLCNLNIWLWEHVKDERLIPKSSVLLNRYWLEEKPDIIRNKDIISNFVALSMFSHPVFKHRFEMILHVPSVQIIHSRLPTTSIERNFS